MRARRDSAIGESEAKESRCIVTIPPKIDEFPVRAGEDELTAPPRASGCRLVHEEIDADLGHSFRELDRREELPPVVRCLPGSAHAQSSSPPLDRSLLHLRGAGSW